MRGEAEGAVAQVQDVRVGAGPACKQAEAGVFCMKSLERLVHDDMAAAAHTPH